MEGATPESLRLFKAHVLDRDALAAAVAGCEGVFHVASPVPAEKVADPEDWYSAAKTMAEQAALEYGEKNGLIVVTVCPCVVLGPLLQPVVNTTSELLIYIMKGGPSLMKNVPWNIVDVRDVADALLLVYEKVDSCERYICAPDRITTKDMVNLLKKAYPNYNYVDCDGKDYESAISRVTSEKLTSLGWKPRKMEETLCDSVECFKKAGLLQDVEGCPCRLPHLFHFASDK
ncbi:unnamed protein product [Urochloa decumbens]|uniref:NAD-dependent epimerase/dehydratase domain-containing protein n=1 Tax=Urochloa decumbens TaxID=240449 RepID=A0ABC9EWB2_9POAL